jgi:hypothetical protein
VAVAALPYRTYRVLRDYFLIVKEREREQNRSDSDSEFDDVSFD